MNETIKLVIFITCACLLCFLFVYKADENAKITRNIKENNLMKNKNTIMLNTDNSTFYAEAMTTFEFEGCEYIMYRKYVGTERGVLGLTHKGNCKYCNKTSK